MDMSHGGMSSGDGAEVACKMSMLFNFYTTDACFLTPQWRIRTRGDFIGSLVAVWAIVVALEMFRRIGRNYDRAIRRTYYAREKAAVDALGKNNDPAFAVRPFRPSFGQHFIRSTFYFVQFSISYVLMLLGMYFNGAILFAIFLGGFTGYLISARDTLGDEDTPMNRGECCA